MNTKPKAVVGFRLPPTMSESWGLACKATGASDSELARACIQEGFKKAVSKLMRARKRAEDSMMFGGKDRPFSNARIFAETACAAT